MKTTLNGNRFSCRKAGKAPAKVMDTVTAADVAKMLDRYGYAEETREIIQGERLLPAGVLSRLQATYPQHSGLLEARPFLFRDREQYSGLEGFREVVKILAKNGIEPGQIAERELFVEVYRFKASRHLLNSINWNQYEEDSMYQLVFPQPGMMRKKVRQAYLAAKTEKERQQVVEDYMEETNPHDGKQLLNKPWMEVEEGGIEVLEGSQHKYPQCQLIFDQTTQNCFAYCTYCFRHAQVRGDQDMFIQEDIAQVHKYLRAHPEVTDILITGGDAGYLTVERLGQYVRPILEDRELLHIRAVRLGSRLLTYQPELILSRKYDPMLAWFDTLRDNGVQLCWMAHFSTPRELLNPSTLAALRRLQNHGVVVRSQSPIMNHVSLFTDQNGRVDVERSARNWIDLAHILAALSVRFHAMYCARPTGEQHYFAAPLADIEKVFNLIYRSLASLHRPSRYITMTSSAGKVSLLGTAEVAGEKVFALKFNESRNMAWMDRVFLAKYDAKESRVDKLVPLDTPKFFFEDELKGIENELNEIHRQHFPRAGGAIATPNHAKARR
jgi:L-lysine 2,3-aminomutase